MTTENLYSAQFFNSFLLLSQLTTMKIAPFYLYYVNLNWIIIIMCSILQTNENKSEDASSNKICILIKYTQLGKYECEHYLLVNRKTFLFCLRNITVLSIYRIKFRRYTTRTKSELLLIQFVHFFFSMSMLHLLHTVLYEISYATYIHLYQTIYFSIKKGCM